MRTAIDWGEPGASHLPLVVHTACICNTSDVMTSVSNADKPAVLIHFNLHACMPYTQPCAKGLYCIDATLHSNSNDALSTSAQLVVYPLGPGTSINSSN